MQVDDESLTWVTVRAATEEFEILRIESEIQYKKYTLSISKHRILLKLMR